MILPVGHFLKSRRSKQKFTAEIAKRFSGGNSLAGDSVVRWPGVQSELNVFAAG